MEIKKRKWSNLPLKSPSFTTKIRETSSTTMTNLANEVYGVLWKKLCYLEEDEVNNVRTDFRDMWKKKENKRKAHGGEIIT